LCTLRESNPQPSGPKPDTLSIELRVQIFFLGRSLGIEPRSQVPQTRVLPLNYDRHQNKPLFLIFYFSAPTRIRTWDRLLKRQLLYQLSYGCFFAIYFVCWAACLPVGNFTSYHFVSPGGIEPPYPAYLHAILYPQEESNLYIQLRRLVFYPLNYRGILRQAGKAGVLSVELQGEKMAGGVPATNSLEGYCSVR
jgi:hypothetical protein